MTKCVSMPHHDFPLRVKRERVIRTMHIGESIVALTESKTEHSIKLLSLFVDGWASGKR